MLRQNLWQRITILHKILGSVSAIILVLGFFGITKYTDLMQRYKSDAMGRIHGTSSASVDATPEIRNTDTLGIPDNPLANGKTYNTVLRPQDMSSHRWDIGETSKRVFHSPKDKSKWAEVAIKKTSHFQRLELRVRDNFGDIESEEIGVEDAKPGRNIEVQTKAFTLITTICKANTRDDPDPTKPFSGKVFEKVSMDIKVAER